MCGNNVRLICCPGSLHNRDNTPAPPLGLIKLEFRSSEKEEKKKKE